MAERVDTARPHDADGALVELYRAHYRPLVRLAALLLDDIGSSEEVVQDAFVRVHGSWHRLRDPDAALPYLRTAVLNGARSRMRRRQVAARHIEGPPQPAPSAESSAISAEQRRAVVAALRTLPAKQREATVLRYYGELTDTEIAAAMGISPGSVKTHLHRGKAALAKALEPLT